MQEAYFGYRFLLLGLILAANAFFAAAEVALLTSRRSLLTARAGEGHVGAQAALSLLANSERLLSVVQVGVTLASLGMGWAGQETVFELLSGLLAPLLPPGSAAWLHGISFAVAFLAMTFLHVVIGEVVPKNIAVENAEKLAELVAPPLLVFYRVSEPFVWVIERSAARISRLLGVKGETHGGGHSAEELKFIVASSRSEGHLRSFEENAIQRVLDLHNYSAREIMVPRNDIASVAVEATLDEVLRVMSETQYSRLPVHEGRKENIVGVLYSKDLIRLWRAQQSGTATAFRPRRLMHPPLVVPETKPLNQLIDEFRTHRSHMALVVDEFGTIAGMVTLEDVLEQIFGKIEDEHDLRRPAPRTESATLDLEGATTIRDMETQYGIVLPGDAGFETLAGFLLFRFGRIPAVAESLDYGGRRFTVTEMNRHRILRVRVEKLREA